MSPTPTPYGDGPPPGHTGGFGEPTCQRCHFGAELNAPGGTLRLSGPQAYQPGRTYDLMVELERAGLRRAGIQLAVRFAEGERAGQQAGALRAPDTRLEVRADSTGILFAQHRQEGSAVQQRGRTSWTIEWTAPDAREPVVFNLAGNACNDDGSEFGDHVYTTSVRLSPRYH